MKNKQIRVVMLATVLAAGLLPAVASAYSLIVAPARFSVLQVLFDVIDKRSAVLVSYQGEAGTENPVMHVWSGAAWNPLGLHELQELSFLQRSPDRAVLIGDDDLLPQAISDRLAWMPQLVRIRDLGNATLINELDAVMSWSDYEWRWFAGRYKLDIEDRAATKRKASWYDQPGPLRKNEPARQPPVRELREPAPVPVTTRVIEQPAVVEPEVIAIPEPPALETPPAPVVEAPVIVPPPQAAPEQVTFPSYEVIPEAAPEPDVAPAPAPEPVVDASVAESAASASAPAAEAGSAPAQDYSLDNLIQDLQAPAPAPAIEDTPSAK
jgi:hypothetical protein